MRSMNIYGGLFVFLDAATHCLGSTSNSAWNFTVYSDPIELRYGQVYQKGLEGVREVPTIPPLPLPDDVVKRYAVKDRRMAITGFDVDMIRKDASGAESRVLLSSHYLHHYALFFGEAEAMLSALGDAYTSQMLTGCHSMKSAGLVRAHGKEYKGVYLGSASGAEYRHNPQRYQAPFRLILEQPEVWTPYVHIINTDPQLSPSRGSGVSHLLECPCSPQRDINVANGTIDGKRPFPPIRCSPDFAASGNPSCHLSTYVGGYRCCEDEVFLIDTAKECRSPDCPEKPKDKVYMKFTFYYEDAKLGARQLEQSACCDTTAGMMQLSQNQGNENIEYDVLACPEGTPEEKCIHVTESLQPVGFFGSQYGHKGSDLVDIVFASPHIHYGGLSLELIDPETNRTLCKVQSSPDNSGGVIYGKGSEPGDENGYLVGLLPCSWSGTDAPRFRRDHILRTRAVYNASQGHTGVMALWLMSVSSVPIDDANDPLHI